MFLWQNDQHTVQYKPDNACNIRKAKYGCFSNDRKMKVLIFCFVTKHGLQLSFVGYFLAKNVRNNYILSNATNFCQTEGYIVLS